jgi:NAD(P)-dependent dehydrogenase (short-subunit alcohol dehydrogenase family)
MSDIPPLDSLISLKGKTALITGSATGIGRSIAYRLAEAGADLELVDINNRGLRTVKRELSIFDSEVNIHKTDISQKDEITALWEELSGEEPDILINNAGMYPFKSFTEIDEDFLKKVMDVNLNSAFWMCHYMIKSRLRKGGVIVNISSIEAILPFAADLVPYTMSKSGIIALTRSLAREYGSSNFRINVVIPGGILTPGTKAVAKQLYQFDIGVLKSGVQYKLRLPLGRGGQPDEVARVVLFLASDLSSYVHGSLVTVDGGFLST